MISEDFNSRSTVYLDEKNLFIPGKVVEFYNGANYDSDCVLLGYILPRKLVEFTLPYIKEHLCQNEYQVLDIGAGTGHIAKELNNAGFKGVIDAIDGSEDMLNEAKSMYRKHEVHILTSTSPMPFSDESYDLILSGGTVHTCMITPDCLQDFIRVCKKDGLIIFSSGMNEQNFIEEIDRVVDQLVSSNRWALLEKKSVVQYEQQSDNPEESDNKWEEHLNNSKYAMIYCLKKL